jgi:Uma2 family endonuclease
MTTALKYSIFDLDYPESDGLPLAESDATRDYLIYGVEALDRYFQNRADVYVSGNLFIYYEQGNPKAVVAPDVFVVIGAEKKQRPSYKVWEEQGKLPDFVIEITSKSTASEDRGTKRGLYAYLGIPEYFQYDPTADYLKPPLQGFRLVDGNYLPILGRTVGDRFSIYAETLGLELWLEADGEMRFYEPNKGIKLLSSRETEQAKIQAEQEKLLAQQKVKKLEEKLRQLGIDPDSL